jgi:Domain of unknown function (DUF4388)
VATTFLVAIEGLDAAPGPRQGDISATGVYFETSADVGGAGTIHWLHLVSADSVRQIRVMACVVRTAMMNDADGERFSGAAFEFMPESDEVIAGLHEFVRYVLALRFLGTDPHIAPRLDAEALARVEKGVLQAARKAMVRKLSVRSMVLETSWAIAPGESVRVDIVAPGMTRRIRLEGKAIRVAPAKASNPSVYTIEVEVEEESDRPLRTNSSMSFRRVRPEEDGESEQSSARSRPVAAAPSARETSAALERPGGPNESGATRMLEDLLSALILPSEEEPQGRGVHHLTGQLSRVGLPTLCALFEMERMTGVLVVRRDIEEARIYVDGGQIVDLEPVAPTESARARLKELLTWTEGTFEFDVKGVRRANQIGMSVTALLLDLARTADEEKSRNQGG